MHGIGGNEDFYGTGLWNSTVMRMAGNMMSTGECKEAIIVIPNIRVSNTPEYDMFSYENYKYYDLFREELTQCLMPYIQSQFSVKTGRENTAIAGFSVGPTSPWHPTSAPETEALCFTTLPNSPAVARARSMRRSENPFEV